MAELTLFQIECEVALTELLADLGGRMTERREAGIRELYITGKIEGTGLEIYIYPEEAQIQGPGVDERFERPAFQSLDELRQRFLHTLAQILRGDAG